MSRLSTLLWYFFLFLCFLCKGLVVEDASSDLLLSKEGSSKAPLVWGAMALCLSIEVKFDIMHVII